MLFKSMWIILKAFLLEREKKKERKERDNKMRSKENGNYKEKRKPVGEENFP